MAKFKFKVVEIRGEFCWALFGTNGKVLAEGRGYKRIGSLMNMLESIFGNSSPQMDQALEKMRITYS